MKIQTMTAQNQTAVHQTASQWKMSVSKFGMQILNWVSIYYKVLADALDEGERIHQLIQERKNEDMLKAARNGTPIRFL